MEDSHTTSLSLIATWWEFVSPKSVGSFQHTESVATTMPSSPMVQSTQTVSVCWRTWSYHWMGWPVLWSYLLNLVFFFLLKGMALKLCRWFIMSWTCRWHCLSPEIDQLNQVLWYHIGAISPWNKIAPFISSILLLFFLFPFIILSFANSTMQNYWISTVCQLLGKAP